MPALFPCFCPVSVQLSAIVRALQSPASGTDSLLDIFHCMCSIHTGRDYILCSAANVLAVYELVKSRAAEKFPAADIESGT